MACVLNSPHIRFFAFTSSIYPGGPFDSAWSRLFYVFIKMPPASEAQSHIPCNRLCSRCLFSIYTGLVGLNYRGVPFRPLPERVHWLKSTGLPHLGQLCSVSNSSEKISISWPHSGHLQINVSSSLNCSKPGQCRGVVMVSS